MEDWRTKNYKYDGAVIWGMNSIEFNWVVHIFIYNPADQSIFLEKFHMKNVSSSQHLDWLQSTDKVSGFLSPF